MTTKRKPVTPTMPAGWWTQLGFYRFYMLREATSIPAVWFSVLLIIGLFSLKGGQENWAEFVLFLQHPVVLIINIIALAAALLHMKTWFDLAPKASIIIIKNHKMAPKPIISALWLITGLVSILILFIALFW